MRIEPSDDIGETVAGVEQVTQVPGGLQVAHDTR